MRQTFAPQVRAVAASRQLAPPPAVGGDVGVLALLFGFSFGLNPCSPFFAFPRRPRCRLFAFGAADLPSRALLGGQCAAALEPPSVKLVENGVVVERKIFVRLVTVDDDLEPGAILAVEVGRGPVVALVASDVLPAVVDYEVDVLPVLALEPPLRPVEVGALEVTTLVSDERCVAVVGRFKRRQARPRRRSRLLSDLAGR